MNPLTHEAPLVEVARDPVALLRSLQEEARSAIQGNHAASFGQGVFALPGQRLLITPRASGESRYPYVHGGMNFWVYGSGYMHANDGLFALFPRRTEGQEPGIAFMAATRGSEGWRPFPLLGVPHTPEDNAEPAERFAVFGPASACYVTRKSGVSFLVRVFPMSATEVSFSVQVVNECETEAEVLLSGFFNPMLRHQIHETDEDRWFRRVTIHPLKEHESAFHFHVNEDKDRHTSLSQEAILEQHINSEAGACIVRTEATPSRQQYMGAVSRSLANALSLREGTFGPSRTLCTFIEPSIAADLTEVRLAPGASVGVEYFFRILEDQPTEVAAPRKPKEIENLLASHEKHEARHAAALVMECHESTRAELDADVFTHFFTHLMKQVEFCSLIRGYVQLSENSLIGIRDIFQALEALAYWRPDAARTKMLEALAFTLEDGRCLRQYSLPKKNGEPGRADIRPFIDQGVWVISTVATYMRLTGDTTFLGETCGYHHLTAGRAIPSSQSDTVLEHLQRILDYLLAHLDPRTGCLRALYGDWNDALDGLGVLPGGGDGYGSGVSVMASLQVLQNLREMELLLQLHGTPADAPEIASLQRQAEALASSLWQHAVTHGPGHALRILHGWGHEGAYHVGSFRDADGAARDSVTSNAFWVLCGMLERHPETSDAILAAFERLDSKYGLRTFQPEFPANEGRFGRIGKLPSGTAENAGTYVHATAFGIMALFEMGEAKLAWEQLIKVLPFTPLHGNLSHSPFVMPNSYGYNPDLGIDGQNMNDWQTGSSNVVLKTILRHVIGLRMDVDALELRPAEYCPFRRWDAQLCIRGRHVAIYFENIGAGMRTYHVNDELQPTHPSPQDRVHGLRLNVEEHPLGAIITVRIAD